MTGDTWILTNIYGPSQENSRMVFLNWLQNIDMPDETKWILMGDFNYIRYPNNRNRNGGNFRDMLNFNEAISTLGLVKIPLKGREYTWSNMQSAPLLQKLDWVFTSESWTTAFPNTLAIPLAKPISDHTPCVVQISTQIPKAAIFRFENYWLRM